MGYKESLKSPLWKEKRDIILARDGHTCRRCGSDAQAVHHRYYLNRTTEPWDYPDSALLSLCHRCHEREHKIKPISDFLFIPEEQRDFVNFPDAPKKRKFKEIPLSKLPIKCRIAEIQRKVKESKDKRASYSKYCEGLFDEMLFNISNHEAYSDIQYFTNKPVLNGKNLTLFKSLLDRNILFVYQPNMANFVEGVTPKMVQYYLPTYNKVILNDNATPMDIRWCEIYSIRWLYVSEALKNINYIHL